MIVALAMIADIMTAMTEAMITAGTAIIIGIMSALITDPSAITRHRPIGHGTRRRAIIITATNQTKTGERKLSPVFC